MGRVLEVMTGAGAMATAILDGRIDQISKEGDMSKASDYAKSMQQRPEFTAHGQRIAYVTSTGKLRLPELVERLLSPEDALRLGRWLCDTFGEKRAVVE